MGLAVVARIYPYDYARAPSHRELIVHAKAYPASSPATKPPESLLRTLPPECVQSCHRSRVGLSWAGEMYFYVGSRSS